MCNEQKTEKPTSYKIKKNYKHGNRMYFKELNTFIILFIIVTYMWLLKENIIFVFSDLIQKSFDFNNFFSFDNFFNFLKFKVFYQFFLFFFLIIFLVNFLVPFFFGNYLLQVKKNFFNFKGINFIKGLKNIFYKNNFYELYMSIIKLVVIMSFYILFVLIIYNELFLFYFYNVLDVLFLSSCIIYIFYILLLLFFFPLVILDILFTKKKYYNLLRMTKTEVKEEKKILEGNSLNKVRFFKKISDFFINKYK